MRQGSYMGMRFRATEFPDGSWLDAEERCYPSGSRYAGRKARAKCKDGVYRIVAVGIPDTYFSIPAHIRRRGRVYLGCVTIKDDGVVFHEYSWVEGDSE